MSNMYPPQVNEDTAKALSQAIVDQVHSKEAPVNIQVSGNVLEVIAHDGFLVFPDIQEIIEYNGFYCYPIRSNTGKSFRVVLLAEEAELLYATPIGILRGFKMKQFGLTAVKEVAQRFDCRIRQTAFTRQVDDYCYEIAVRGQKETARLFDIFCDFASYLNTSDRAKATGRKFSAICEWEDGQIVDEEFGADALEPHIKSIGGWSKVLICFC